MAPCSAPRESTWPHPYPPFEASHAGAGGAKRIENAHSFICSFVQSSIHASTYPLYPVWAILG